MAGFINMRVDPELFIPTKLGKNGEGQSSHGDSKFTDVPANYSIGPGSGKSD